MRRTIDDSIKLFTSKKDSSRWVDRNNKKVLLKENDYYKVLNCPFSFYKSLTGFNQDHNTLVSTKIFVSEDKGLAIAQVASKKLVAKQPISKPNKKSIKKNKNNDFEMKLAIATYLDYDGELVILNRFDPKGLFDHQNNYDIYDNLEEKALYEKYFTDYQTVSKTNKVRYYSGHPHFHFNTRLQSEKFCQDTKANAISLENLIRYVRALDKCQTDNSKILNYSLGMPFLDYKLKNKQFHSHVKQTLLGLSKSNSVSKTMRGFMEDLIMFKESYRNQTPLQNVLSDLYILDSVSAMSKKDNYSVESTFILNQIGSAFMSSISNLTPTNSLEKDGEHEK